MLLKCTSFAETRLISIFPPLFYKVMVESFKPNATPTTASSVDSDLASIEGYAVRVEMFKDSDRGVNHKPFLFSSVTCTSSGLLSKQVEANSAVTFELEKVDPPRDPKTFSLQLPVERKDIELWSPESPSLYTIIISLYSTIDNAYTANPMTSLDNESLRFGIREVDVGGVDNQLRINRKPLTIAGVNRHEFDMNKGRAMDEETMWRDAQEMKALNFNGVRCAHYPHHPRWLEICDAVGLVVVDEANVETHGFQTIGQAVAYLSSRREWLGAHMARVTRMYERDKNASSVITWSLGNESGVGMFHRKAYKWLKCRDSSRLVQYESGGANSSVTDIICPMYHRPSWCRKNALYDSRKRPVALCEYAHAMGNSGGGLEEYWQLFRDPDVPRAQGGFIWDWLDQGLALKNSNGFIGWGYGGDFGDFPNTKQFCCNGICGPDRRPHPIAFQAKALQAPFHFQLEAIGRGSAHPGLTFKDVFISIENRRQFTDTSDIDFKFQLLCDSPKLRNEVTKTVKLNIGPSSEVSISLESIFMSSSSVLADSIISELTSTLKLSLEDLAMANEIWINVSAHLSSPSLSNLPAGHEVTTIVTLKHSVLTSVLDEIRGKISEELIASPRESYSSIPDVTGVYEEDENKVQGVRIQWGDGSSAFIDGVSGRLSSWVSRDGINLISAPVDVCLFRAPTDNDAGGDTIAYKTRWIAAGLDNLSRASVSVSFCEESSSATINATSHDHNTVDVDVVCELVPVQGTFQMHSIPLTTRYSFHSDGKVSIRNTVKPPRYIPPLPRVGIRFAVPEEMRFVDWFGLGPHEAYDDRKQCVHLGTFKQTVESLHVPYVVPQESGRRADPRWVLLHDSNYKSGVMVIPISSDRSTEQNNNNEGSVDTQNPLIGSEVMYPNYTGSGFSASRYSLETITRTNHDYELEEDHSRHVHFHLDSHTMGLGGFDSWSPNVSNEYVLHNTRPFFVDAVLIPLSSIASTE